MAQTAKKNGKKVIISVIVLVVLLAVALIAYFAMKPKADTGTKTISITVVDDQKAEKAYTVKTDAQYLRQAMDEADGLTFSGSTSDFGLVVDTINGVRADYTADKAYWAFYVNGEYCNYGVDQQPVADGDQFKIEYTPAE